MNRQDAVRRIHEQPCWDFIIIGGGATGLGAAVDASARGYRVLLIEQHDFTKGTSSRSTKLVHGGVRYLKQGNLSLVLESLKERGLLCANAPHLVHNLSFIIPIYHWIDTPFYGVGLKVYDRLAGKLGLGHSLVLSVEETVQRIPNVETDGLIHGVLYHDAQFDDARMGLHLACTAWEAGAVTVNYVKAVGLIKEGGLVQGVQALDRETGQTFALKARAVINATGVFVDQIMRLDEPGHRPMVAPSQGIHLVLPRAFLSGDSAIMVPKTRDGRVLFAVPWNDRVVVGTTDTPMDEVSEEPRPLKEEIDFVFSHAAHYLERDPTPEDVLSIFAGLRPLIRSGDAENTAALSRDHTILISDAGLITIAGGKWTTYRKMAEDVIDQAEVLCGFDHRRCPTESLAIHGKTETAPPGDPLSVYGSDRAGVEALIEEDPALGELLHPRLPYLRAEVVWGVREEMARTVEDTLARRTRALLLDARASIEAAPDTARLMARELKRDQDWIDNQVEAYAAVAEGYLPTCSATPLNAFRKGNG